MRRSLPFRVETWLSVGFGLLFLVPLLEYGATRRLLRTNQQVRRTDSILAQIEDIRTALLEITSSMRLYVITGDDTDLAVYRSGSRRVFRDLDAVGGLTTDPGQQENVLRLRTLIQARLAASEKVVAVRSLHGPRAANELLDEGWGSAVTRSISDLTDEMEGEEHRLFDVRDRAVEWDARSDNVMLVLGILLAVGLAIVAGVERWRAGAAQDQVEIPHPRGPTWLVYGVVASSTAATLLTIVAVGPDASKNTPLITLVIPILLGAYLGGLVPGLLTTALSVLVSIYFILPPTHRWRVESPADNLKWTTLLVAGVIISIVSEALLRARSRAQGGEARFAAIIGTALDGIIVVDARRHITLFNPAAEEIFGLRASDALGSRLDRFIPETFDSAEALQVRTFDPSDNAQPPASGFKERRARRADGTGFLVEASISRVELAQGRFFTVILRDITERRQAEAERARLFTAIEQCAEGIIITDLTGTIQYVNSAFTRVTGYSREEAIGRNPRLLKSGHHDRAFYEKFWSTITAGKIWQGEILNRRKDGSLYTDYVRVSPVRDASGKLTHFIGNQFDITERKRAEESLRLRTKALQAAANSIVMTDRNGQIVWVNAAFTALTGYSVEEAVGQNPRVLKSEIQDAEYYHDLWTTILAGKVWHGEIINRRKDGSLYTEEMTITPVRDERGEISHFIAIKQDVTGRKRAEEALFRSQRVLAQAEQLAHLGAWEIGSSNGDDLEKSPLHWSDETYRIFGYEPGSVAISNELFFQHVHPEDRSRTRTTFAQAAADRTPYSIEHRILRRDGEERTVVEHAEIVFDALGRPKRAIGTVQDITERKRSEQALTASEIRYRRLFEAAQDGVLLLDSATAAITDVNPFLLELLGYTREELLGRKLWEIGAFPDVVRSQDTFRDLQRAGFVRYEDLPLETKSGDRREVEFVSNVYEAGGKKVVQCSIRDISERVQAQREIRLLNQELESRVQKRTAELEAANKELEAFTYSVAHDLRAPLRHINGFAQILAGEHAGELSAAAQELLGQIRGGSAHMGRLIDDLLDLARLGRQAMNWQQVDLQELVGEVVRELEPEVRGRSIEWRVGNLASARCDRVLMKQALVNLLSNAVKYTRPRNPAVIELGCQEAGGKKAFYVRDNGVGFSMAYAHKLFGLFQRLHSQEEFEGTGVGLAVVHRVLQRHGGRVWAEAEPGKGAAFYFTLNAAGDGAGQAASQKVRN